MVATVDFPPPRLVRCSIATVGEMPMMRSKSARAGGWIMERA